VAYELVRWAPLLWGGLIIQHKYTHSGNQKFTETKGSKRRGKADKQRWSRRQKIGDNLLINITCSAEDPSSCFL